MGGGDEIQVLPTPVSHSRQNFHVLRVHPQQKEKKKKKKNPTLSLEKHCNRVGKHTAVRKPPVVVLFRHWWARRGRWQKVCPWRGKQQLTVQDFKGRGIDVRNLS